jgi:hypothetical protein
MTLEPPPSARDPEEEEVVVVEQRRWRCRRRLAKLMRFTQLRRRDAAFQGCHGRARRRPVSSSALHAAARSRRAGKRESRGVRTSDGSWWGGRSARRLCWGEKEASRTAEHAPVTKLGGVHPALGVV